MKCCVMTITNGQACVDQSAQFQPGQCIEYATPYIPYIDDADYRQGIGEYADSPGDLPVYLHHSEHFPPFEGRGVAEYEVGEFVDNGPHAGKVTMLAINEGDMFALEDARHLFNTPAMENRLSWMSCFIKKPKTGRQVVEEKPVKEEIEEKKGNGGMSSVPPQC